MKRSDLSLPKILVVLVALTLAGVRLSAAQNPTPDERLASIKASLAQSKEALKSYEWIETTVVTVKGEEKYRAEYKCYYGADGKMQKVVVVAPPEPPKKKGLFRGKSAVSQAEYIKNAIELVKTYLPPDPAKIEACKSAGKVSYTPAGSTMGLGFHDYQKPGDVLGIQVDMAKNTLMSVGVDTWMKDAADKVALTSKFGSLKDGTMYIEERNLKAPSQSIEVKVTNSGYRKVQN